MKKLVIISSVLLMGCASVSYNPSTGEVHYTRIGDQHIQGFEVKKSKDGDYKVKMESQQSQAEALTEAIRIIGTLSAPK